MRIVTIDPRRTATSDLADLHLPLRPDTDVALFNGLLNRIAQAGAIDANYVAAHVSGLRRDARRRAGATLGHTAAETAASTATTLAAFYELWIATPRVVTVSRRA